jgi:GT2 family glycosyltransferase
MMARAILILGMHRSGTSAVTRMMNLLGVSLGRQLKPAAEDNPRGFWEHESVVQIHEKLLSELGMSWDDPRPLPTDWLQRPCAAAALKEIRTLVEAEFGDKTLWAVKDPRACRFVPLWRAALEGLEIELSALFVHRGPAEVARSLNSRNGLPEDVAGLLWARYLQDAEMGSRGLVRGLVHYEGLLSDWRSAVREIEATLGIRLDLTDERARSVDEFLSSDLRHHATDAQATATWLWPLEDALRGRGSTEARLSAFADSASELERALSPFAGLLSGLSLVAVQSRESATESEARAAQHALELRAATEWGAERDRELRASLQQAEELRAELARAGAWGEGRDEELRAALATLAELRSELETSSNWGASKDAELVEANRQLAAIRLELSSVLELRAATEKRASAAERELEIATRWGETRNDELMRTIELAESLRRELDQSKNWGASKDAELNDAVGEIHSLLDKLGAAETSDAEKARQIAELEAKVLEREAELATLREGQRQELVALKDRVTESEAMLARLDCENKESEARLMKANSELETVRDTAAMLAARVEAIERREARSGFGKALRRLASAGLRLLAAGLRWLVIRIVEALPGSPGRRAGRVAMLRTLSEARRTGTNSLAISTDIEKLASGRWPARPAYSLRTCCSDAALDVDISVVTYHSERWVERFVASLAALDYPLERVRVYVRDHSANDATRRAWEAELARIGAGLGGFEYSRGPNTGFGHGHNYNLRRSRAPLFLVCNVDGQLRPEALAVAVRACASSRESVCAWEFRQAPYEHPKYYDPVTLLTSWVSGACVLFRRSALVTVGGFDERIFMYGEDVDLSYRLRGAGYSLAYVPAAVFDHDTYEEAGQFKALQFHGSTLSNVLLRLRFGMFRDWLAIPSMWMELGDAARQHGVHAGYLRNTWQLIRKAPAFLLSRHRRGTARIPFARWDYGLRREGPFEHVGRQLPREPLVSIVVRTYQGRDALLQQALATIANQTYPNLEVVVVEDKGDSLRESVEEFGRRSGLECRYIPSIGAESNRCVTGNLGIESARGEFICFLDDDDLFFADHVEHLLSRIIGREDLGACYSLAWETKIDVDARTGRYSEVMHSTLPGHRLPFDREKLKSFNYIPIQSVLFRRSLFERYGGLNPSLDNLEDWNLWVRYSWRHDFLLCPKTTSMYHVPGDPAHQAVRQAKLDEYYEVAKLENEKARARIDAARVGGA